MNEDEKFEGQLIETPVGKITRVEGDLAIVVFPEGDIEELPVPHTITVTTGKETKVVTFTTDHGFTLMSADQETGIIELMVQASDTPNAIFLTLSVKRFGNTDKFFFNVEDAEQVFLVDMTQEDEA